MSNNIKLTNDIKLIIKGLTFVIPKGTTLGMLREAKIDFKITSQTSKILNKKEKRDIYKSMQKEATKELNRIIKNELLLQSNSE